MYLVTGAAGFIGSAMVWQLNQQGVEDIICCDLMRTGHKWKNLAKLKFYDFVQKDELFDFLQSEFAIQNIQTVFHMGACSSTTESDVDYLMKNNYQFSQILFDWCNVHGKQFIYASSAATYGAGELGYDDQTDSNKLKPLNAYGYSKVLFDRWIVKQKVESRCHWVGLKFFNVFGPNEYHKTEMSSVVYKAYKQIKSTGDLGLFKSYLSQYKDGEQMRDFVYVKDVTRWMWEIHKNKTASGIYNMGFGKARTWKDLALNVFKNMNKEAKINWIEMPENVRHQYQYFTEAKMEKLLKQPAISKPQWPLEKAIEDYVKNYLLKDDIYL